MAVDEDSSIYVGGLPYNATEDTIRRVFDPYGSIVTVKIINDHGTRGKCYCFVTFRNPRSVIDAIDDMNGKTIDGRVVKVNGVTSRGGRSNFSRERFRHNADRGAVEWDRGRDHERDYDRDRGKYRERYSDRSRERVQPWDHDEDEDKRYEHAQDHVHIRDDFIDGDRGRERDLVGNEPEEGRNNSWNWGHNLRWDRGREMDATNSDDNLVHNETYEHSRKQIDSRYNGQHSREISSESVDVEKERLERSIQRRDELKKEISEMEGRLEDKQLHVSVLRKRTQKLEDALVTAKKHSSQHKMQLTKLHKYFLQVKEYSEKLKSSEEELEALVASAMIQNDASNDFDLRTES